MTTLTDKELIKEIKERIGSLDIRDNIERRAYEIALASLEAKPIGAFHIAEQQVDGTSDYLKDGEWPIDNGIIEVYAAPPVPVVPEEKPMPNPLSMYAVDAVAAIAEVRGWNACRSKVIGNMLLVDMDRTATDNTNQQFESLAKSEWLPVHINYQCALWGARFSGATPMNNHQRRRYTTGAKIFLAVYLLALVAAIAGVVHYVQ